MVGHRRGKRNKGCRMVRRAREEVTEKCVLPPQTMLDASLHLLGYAELWEGQGEAQSALLQ